MGTPFIEEESFAFYNKCTKLQQERVETFQHYKNHKDVPEVGRNFLQEMARTYLDG